MTPSGSSKEAAPEDTRVTRLGPGSLPSGKGLSILRRKHRPLSLQGLGPNRPVHAWESEGVGKEVEEAVVLCGVTKGQMQRLEKGRHWLKVTEKAGIVSG